MQYYSMDKNRGIIREKHETLKFPITPLLTVVVVPQHLPSA